MTESIAAYVAAVVIVVDAMSPDAIRAVASEGYRGDLPPGAEALDEDKLRRLVQLECNRRDLVSAAETISAPALGRDG